ncbi:hypothetical protein GCM10018785_26560 [Streptomyces longispororuber]|uniref:Uncharacterized protein n=1 Tax=Streptomyces longispororuber TaxID=68230 RepID=A0A919DL95_9ACTN|nr:hypothetical protein GCM10018785_26560 [Streptomyces longispororuber]
MSRPQPPARPALVGRSRRAPVDRPRPAWVGGPLPAPAGPRTDPRSAAPAAPAAGAPHRSLRLVSRS